MGRKKELDRVYKNMAWSNNTAETMSYTVVYILFLFIAERSLVKCLVVENGSVIK